jgi:peptide/nickel transport system permease protein
LIIGLTMGLTAAYFGGKFETLVMRIVDIQLSFPAILIALILIACWTGHGKVITALVTVQWRTTRAPYAARRWWRSAANTWRRRAACFVTDAHRVPASAAIACRR